MSGAIALKIVRMAAKWFFLPLQTNLTENGVTNYFSLFLVPTALSLFAALTLALFFRPPPEEKPIAVGAPATAH